RPQRRMLVVELPGADPAHSAGGLGQKAEAALDGLLVDSVVERDPDVGCRRDGDGAALGWVIHDLRRAAGAACREREQRDCRDCHRREAAGPAGTSPCSPHSLTLSPEGEWEVV